MNDLSTEPVQPAPEPAREPIHEPGPEPLRDPPPADSATRRPVPVGGIFGLVVILLLLGAGAGYYAWRDQTVRQNRQIVTLNGEIGALKAQIAAIAAQRQTPPPPAKVKVPASLTGKIDSLQQNVNALAASVTTERATITSQQANVQSRLDRLQSKLGDVQANLKANLGAMPALAARARRLDRIAMASLALQNGQPLGSIKNAPPALARYATTAPPTRAGLRREFPAAARRAIAAGGDVQATSGYWQRLKMRVAGLVTLRRHGHVLVGSRVSGILAAAQNDLDTGDLQDAVAVAQTLPPPAKAAMQGWLDQANGLLAARHALADPALLSPAGSK